jgi:hypothetical protein
MPKLVATHDVKDVDHWVSKHDERVEIFSGFATNIVSYVAADGSNRVALSADITDMAAMAAYMQSPKAAEGMEAHGVSSQPVMHLEAPAG